MWKCRLFDYNVTTNNIQKKKDNIKHNSQNVCSVDSGHNQNITSVSNVYYYVLIYIYLVGWFNSKSIFVFNIMSK